MMTQTERSPKKNTSALRQAMSAFSEKAYVHQMDMMTSVRKVLCGETKRMHFICATGGGKTYVEFESIVEGFARGFDFIVMVAPTIALLTQHHKNFVKQELLKKEGADCHWIHFRTGADPEEKNYDRKVTVTTDQAKLLQLVNEPGKKKLVLVTYASLAKLFSTLKAAKVDVDLTVFDEYHHCVKNGLILNGEKKNAHWWHDFYLNLNSERCLFFSASRKAGKVMRSTDREVFGELGCEVSFAKLQRLGIVVPNIVVHFVRRSTVKRISLKLDEEIKTAGLRKGFEMKDYLMELAVTLFARRDMLLNEKKSVILTFSQKVAMMEAAMNEEAFLSACAGAVVRMVSGKTDARVREEIIKLFLEPGDDKVLLNHSVFKEGIDITPFNAMVLCRALGSISLQQALGRIARAHPNDTKSLKQSQISLSSKEGWVKPTAHVYVMVNDETDEGFALDVREFIDSLVEIGINPTLNPDGTSPSILVELAGEEEEKYGKEYDESGILDKPRTVLVKVTEEQLKKCKLVQETVERVVKDMADTLFVEEAKKKSNKELFAML